MYIWPFHQLPSGGLRFALYRGVCGVYKQGAHGPSQPVPVGGGALGCLSGLGSDPIRRLQAYAYWECSARGWVLYAGVRYFFLCVHTDKTSIIKRMAMNNNVKRAKHKPSHTGRHALATDAAMITTT